MWVVVGFVGRVVRFGVAVDWRRMGSRCWMGFVAGEEVGKGRDEEWRLLRLGEVVEVGKESKELKKFDRIEEMGNLLLLLVPLLE